MTKDEKAWQIADKIHQAKKDLIEHEKTLREMKYVVHFNRDGEEAYAPTLYRLFRNSYVRVERK